MHFDLSTDFGARLAARLQTEYIVWLTTVRADLTPQPTPVWFWWDGAAVLIYSQPKRQKVINIEQRPTVALHFNSDARGDEVMVITGTARIDPATPSALHVPAYLEKYRDGIPAIQMTPESFAASYTIPLRVTPLQMRGY
jgi:PPOX class probable F420-dependent enzyme